MALVEDRPDRDGLSHAAQLLPGIHRVRVAGQEHHTRDGRYLQLREPRDRGRARLVDPGRAARAASAHRHGGDLGRRRIGELGMGTVLDSWQTGRELKRSHQSRRRMTSTRPREPMNDDPIQLTMLTMSAAPIAVQKPASLNPGSMSATRPSIAAFTTNRNRPSVSTSAGSESSSAKGRTMALTTPNNRPASTSVVGELMEIPLSIAVAAQSPSAAISPRNKKPAMSLVLLNLVQALLEEDLETGQRHFPVPAPDEIVRHPALAGRHSARQQPDDCARGSGAFEQEVFDDHGFAPRHARRGQQDQSQALRRHQHVDVAIQFHAGAEHHVHAALFARCDGGARCAPALEHPAVGEGPPHPLDRRVDVRAIGEAAVAAAHLRNAIHTTGSIETPMIPMVTNPKLFLMTGMLPKKKPAQTQISTQPMPPAKL